MWLLGLVLGCGAEGVTSETTLAGRVLDASGAPVEGLLVQSLEGQAHTAPDGTFAVEVKAPNQLAHFTSKGIWYQRTVTAVDHGLVVDLRLPSTRAARVSCPPQACDLLLSWDLAPSFEGHVRHACTPGAGLDVPAAPVDTPAVRCTLGKGKAAKPLELQVLDRGDSLKLVPVGTPLRVELRGPDGRLPDDCVVRIGDRVAVPAGPGFWSAEASGPVTVTAACHGRAALPTRVVPGEVDAVVVEWSSTGPTLDLEGVAPWAAEVVVVAEAEGWNLPLAPTAQGQFLLPPLPEGTYRLLIRAEGVDLPLLAQPPAPAGHGVLALVAAGEGALVGRLQVVGDLESGAVRVAAE